MNREKIKAFAVEQGYSDVSPLGQWQGYDIYEPLFNGDEISIVGPPLLVMVKGSTIRMSTFEESYEQLDTGRVVSELTIKEAPLFLTDNRWYTVDLQSGKAILTTEGQSIPKVVTSYRRFYKLHDSMVKQVK